MDGTLYESGKPPVVEETIVAATDATFTADPYSTMQEDSYHGYYAAPNTDSAANEVLSRSPRKGILKNRSQSVQDFRGERLDGSYEEQPTRRTKSVRETKHEMTVTRSIKSAALRSDMRRSERAGSDYSGSVASRVKDWEVQKQHGGSVYSYSRSMSLKEEELVTSDNLSQSYYTRGHSKSLGDLSSPRSYSPAWTGGSSEHVEAKEVSGRGGPPKFSLRSDASKLALELVPFQQDLKSKWSNTTIIVITISKRKAQ